MYRPNQLFLVSTLVFAGVVSACEGDYSRGPRNGIADATALSALSSAQASAMCREFDEYRMQIAGGVDRIGCTVAALMFGGTGASCEKYRSGCMPAAEPAANCDNPVEQSPLLRCTLSVGEHRACLDALLQETESIEEATTCASNYADVPNYTALQPEACRVVRDKCPELLAD